VLAQGKGDENIQRGKVYFVHNIKTDRENIGVVQLTPDLGII
jgi:hypothetical protein